MYQQLKKELHTLSAALDSEWNWRAIRSPCNAVQMTENLLPVTNREFMNELGDVVHGNVIIYGGALNDLARNKAPKDFDGFILGQSHPLLTMAKVDKWAKSRGHVVSYRKRRVRFLWKQIMIETGHGVYDLTCLQGYVPLPNLLETMADAADVSPCARAALVTHAYQSERCAAGESRQQLIFRPFDSERARSRHFDRWLKYAIVKYPEREVVYQDESDAKLFAELSERRSEIKFRYDRLTAAGQRPENFKPFIPLFRGLYDKMQAATKLEPR